MLSQHALQVVSQHALQQVSRGVLGPGGSDPGGYLVPGGSAPGGCLVGGYLLRAVRILLECILVSHVERVTKIKRNFAFAAAFGVRLPTAREGNVFTSICHSVQRGLYDVISCLWSYGPSERGDVVHPGGCGVWSVSWSILGGVVQPKGM